MTSLGAEAEAEEPAAPQAPQRKAQEEPHEPPSVATTTGPEAEAATRRSHSRTLKEAPRGRGPAGRGRGTSGRRSEASA